MINEQINVYPTSPWVTITWRSIVDYVRSYILSLKPKQYELKSFNETKTRLQFGLHLNCNPNREESSDNYCGHVSFVIKFLLLSFMLLGRFGPEGIVTSTCSLRQGEVTIPMVRDNPTRNVGFPSLIFLK